MQYIFVDDSMIATNVKLHSIFFATNINFLIRRLQTCFEVSFVVKVIRPRQIDYCYKEIYFNYTHLLYMLKVDTINRNLNS